MKRKEEHSYKKSSRWAEQLLVRAERPLVIILHLGIFFSILNFEWADLMISIPTVFLAIIYLFCVSAVLPGNTTGLWAQILFKASYFGCSIAVAGLFLKFMGVPVFKLFLMPGTVLLFLVYLGVLIHLRKYTGTTIYKRKDYIRNLAIIIVGSTYYFTPV